MIKIIDNFLTKSYHEKILMQLTSFEFEWSMYYSGPHHAIENTEYHKYGFSHHFWKKDRGGGKLSRLTSFINPLLLHIQDVADCDFIIRARADMVTWLGKEEFSVHEVHHDFPFPNIGTIFYVNESDGDTIFYNVKPDDIPKGKTYKDLKIYDKVSPKANRLVLFDGDYLHTGYAPTKHRSRILINSNYIKKEYKEIFDNYSGS